MKKKVLIFTGAGVSAEIGVETFRTDERGCFCWYGKSNDVTNN
jgi:NAD-dependent SIR2 family protein deacetylase